MDDILLERHIIEKLLIKENKSFNELLNNSDSLKEHMVDINDVNDIIYSDEFDNGTYGFLNYPLNFNYDTMKNNKYKINNKKIKNDQYDELLGQNYGLLDLFLKQDNVIRSLNVYHFIKDNNINLINKTNYNKIDIDELDDNFIITKIYKIETNKIKLLYEMTKKDFIVEDKISKQIKDYTVKMNSLCLDNKKLLDYLLNFDNIDRLREIISLNENLYNVEDIMTYKFSKIINSIKISNRYEKDIYNNIINKYYGSEYQSLYDKLIAKYNIKKNIVKNALKIVLETLMRIYVDEKTNHNTYCLNKILLSSIPQTNNVNLDTSSKILINRYCKKILLNDKYLEIVDLMYQFLKKDHDMIYIISYLDGL